MHTQARHDRGGGLWEGIPSSFGKFVRNFLRKSEIVSLKFSPILEENKYSFTFSPILENTPPSIFTSSRPHCVYF
jgi:hypothetical protein